MSGQADGHRHYTDIPNDGWDMVEGQSEPKALSTHPAPDVPMPWSEERVCPACLNSSRPVREIQRLSLIAAGEAFVVGHNVEITACCKTCGATFPWEEWRKR